MPSVWKIIKVHPGNLYDIQSLGRYQEIIRTRVMARVQPYDYEVGDWVVVEEANRNLKAEYHIIQYKLQKVEVRE